MPFILETTEDSCRLNFNGDVTFKTIAESQQQVDSILSLRNIKYILADFLDAEITVAENDVSELAMNSKIDSIGHSGIREAIIIREEDQHLAEMYVAFARKHRSSFIYKIFNDKQEAKNWATA